jgi:DNA-binding transcriptional regulator YiaG
MAEVDDVISGRVRPEERLTIRTVELPDDPADYGPREVRAVREGLNVSQMVFAHLIGASPALVRAWEQGGRVPSPMARRLLDSIRRDPRPWRAMVRRAG